MNSTVTEMYIKSNERKTRELLFEVNRKKTLSVDYIINVGYELSKLRLELNKLKVHLGKVSLSNQMIDDLKAFKYSTIKPKYPLSTFAKEIPMSRRLKNVLITLSLKGFNSIDDVRPGHIQSVQGSGPKTLIEFKLIKKSLCSI